MKKLKLIPWILSLAIFALGSNVWAADTEDVTETVIDSGDSVENTPENILFNFSLSEGDNITVNSLTGYRVANGAVITMDYESTDVRDVSFFDPPDGETIKKIIYRGIKPGHNQLQIVLGKEQLANALKSESITMMLGFSDKSSFLNFSVKELEELPIRDGELPDTNTGEINFGLEASPNDSLVVHSLTGYRVSNGVVLKLKVTSPDVRSVSLFNPPDGDRVMKFFNQVINKGDGTVTIEILDSDVAKLLEDDTVTMKLGLSAAHTFVFFSSDVLKDLPLKDGEIKNANELNYLFKSLKGDTLTISSLKAFKNGNGIRFELVLESPDKRSFSLFNPPNGNKFMKQYANKIKKGKNKLTLIYNEKEYSNMMANQELTFRLGFASKCSFITIRTTDLVDLPSK